MDPLESQIQSYAELIVHQGVNIQPGQSLVIRAEIVHRPFVHRVVAAAYGAGARFVDVDWSDPHLVKARLEHSSPEHLDFLPDALAAKADEQLRDGWASVSLVGKEWPDLLEGVDTEGMRRMHTAYYRKMEPWRSAAMRNQVAWNVSALPTAAWACQVFPNLAPEDAVQALWSAILAAAHVTPHSNGAAWAAHMEQLQRISDFLNSRPIDSLHFFDPTPGPDGLPSTDLTIGLTARPFWVSGSSPTTQGIIFSPNIPTEEAFVTPDRDRATGWTRSSKPLFPFDQEVRGAWFRFADGQVVDYSAEKGGDVLDQYFGVEGTRRLGEVALVDAGSPIFQSGILFHNTLFDENAAIHLAFGRGYAIGIQDGGSLTPEELDELGLNLSTLHLDTMIGTETMQVTAHYSDGSALVIMEKGRYTRQVLEEKREAVPA